MQSILTPAAFVLATITQQLDPVPMPLTVLVLSEILVELGVMAEAESTHHAVLEHSLVDEAIVVQQGADPMHLVVIINLTVVKAVLDLESNKLFFQITAKRGLQSRPVELLERASLLLVLFEVEVEVGEEALDSRQ